MRVAVIGAGVSGNVIARLLHAEHEVVLLEAGPYAGGHTNTVDVELAGARYPVDTGFTVFNRRTYPNFCRLLALLGVQSQPSDMSFSVQCQASGLEYQGSSLNGLFAQRSNLLRPAYYNMLGDCLRFNRQATAAWEQQSIPSDLTVGQFLRQNRLGTMFLEKYLVPMAAAIWSAQPASILHFPARFLIGFFHNHGLMQLKDRPQWMTIAGGARKYVEALLAPLNERVRLNSPVKAVTRLGEQVQVTGSNGSTELFDHVVLATHADVSLNMLTDATPSEREILSAFPYQANRAVLHTDISWLPRRRRAWASWNYRIAAQGEQRVSVTYDLSRLQNHASPQPVLLTLNPAQAVAPQHIIRTMRYHHPAYSAASIAAQSRLGEISGVQRTHYCGAYWGYGFHEDGVNSALAVAREFGITSGLDGALLHRRALSKAAS